MTGAAARQVARWYQERPPHRARGACTHIGLHKSSTNLVPHLDALLSDAVQRRGGLVLRPAKQGVSEPSVGRHMEQVHA